MIPRLSFGLLMVKFGYWSSLFSEKKLGVEITAM